VRTASRIFRWAGIYGLIVIAPMYFLEARIGQDYPPAITHPEYFYGFVGVTLAWQLVFLVMATDPARYRPLMLVAIIEKLSFGIAAPILLWMGRVPSMVCVGAAIDLLLAGLFLYAYRRTAPEWSGAAEPTSVPAA
jgi:hypothetical protein